MLDLNALRMKNRPVTYFYQYYKDKVTFNITHPDYFYADGLTVFVGEQGSGKTLSAVNYVYNLLEKYPKSKLVTNIWLSDYPIVSYEEWKGSQPEEILKLSDYDLHSLYKKVNRVFAFNNADDLTEYSNGENGVIYLIDEIQLYFNSLESKNINPDVMVQFSQQRKQRKHIVCTSQVFGRMAKPLREQFSSVVVCKNYFGFIQRNQVVNRDSLNDGENGTSTELKGKVLKTILWIHHPNYYRRYDTYYTISRNKFISEEKKAVNIYDSRPASSS